MYTEEEAVTHGAYLLGYAPLPLFEGRLTLFSDHQKKARLLGIY